MLTCEPIEVVVLPLCLLTYEVVGMHSDTPGSIVGGRRFRVPLD
jgi:hypothetical protein